MSENENITSPGVPESESGSASLSEESEAVPCSSADDATLSDAPFAEGGGAEEECAGAPEEEAEKGPETYIVTADGIPVGGTAYRRGNAIWGWDRRATWCPAGRRSPTTPTLPGKT